MGRREWVLVRGRSVYRDFSPGGGLRNRSYSRGRGKSSSKDRNSSKNMLKDIKTMMCDITKAIKGGLSTDQAVQKCIEKVDEMFTVKDIEDEHESHNFLIETSNFDEQASAEDIQSALNTLQSLANTYTYNVTNYVKNEPNGKSKVDCGAPKSCANEDYTKEYIKSMGLKLEDMPRVQTMKIVL